MNNEQIEKASMRRPVSENRQLKNKIEKGFDIESMKSYGVYPTANKMGFSSSKLDDSVQNWISSLPESNKPLVDLGCGHGFQTIAALKAGRDVLAIDADERHLEYLKSQVESLSERSEQGCTNIPGNLVGIQAVRLVQSNILSSESAAGILLSEVLHFLSPEEPFKLFRDVFDWLEPGGRFVVTTTSPVFADFIMHGKGKLTTGGSMEEAWEFVLNASDEELVRSAPFDVQLGNSGIASKVGPGSLNTSSTRQLLALSRLSGFEVEFLDYISQKKIPSLFTGDELVCLVARKAH